MADLYIAEFGPNALSTVGTTLANMFPQPAITVQKIAIGASTVSAAFNAQTRAVLLVADGPCHVEFNNAGAADPAAGTTDLLIPANVPIPFGVQPGAKLAVST